MPNIQSLPVPGARNPLAAASLIGLGLMVPLVAGALAVQHHARSHAPLPATPADGHVAIANVNFSRLAPPEPPATPPAATARRKVRRIAYRHPVRHHEHHRLARHERAQPYPAFARAEPVYAPAYMPAYGAVYPMPAAPWGGYGPAYAYGYYGYGPYRHGRFWRPRY